MALEQEIYSINMVALNVVNAIHGIQIGYLLGNKKYPYGEVNKLIAEYMILFNKYNKKKNSIINKIVNVIIFTPSPLLHIRYHQN